MLLPAPFREWWGRVKATRRARHELRLAQLRAATRLASYKARADLEWDMKWAHEDGRHTLRDEFLIALWAAPAILVFIPQTRPTIIEGFEALKAFSPEAPTAYVAGWGVIVTAAFGLKQLIGLFLPTKFARLAEALGSIKPDVPPEAPVHGDPEDKPDESKD